MTLPNLIERSDMLLDFERDLSVCTFDELQTRWDDHNRVCIETELSRSLKRDVPWSEVVNPQHNPIYYTAERAYFGNKRANGNPKFLYAPLHREIYCREILNHILSPEDSTAALVILGPRDTFKSSFEHGAVPMWYVHRRKHLEGIDVRVVLRHHKEEIASGNLVRLKNKYRFDPWTRRVWHDAVLESGSKELGHSTAFTLPWSSLGDQAEVTFRAIGVNAVDTGLHSDLDLGDDLENEDHLTSRKIRNDAQLRYDARRFQLDPEGREVNTGTPYHPAGLWMWMEKAMDDDGVPLYRFVRVPAIAKLCNDCGHEGEDHLAKEKCIQCGCESTAALSHPHRLTWRVLNRRRKQEMGRSHNDTMWRRQYQVQIRAEKDIIGDSSWLRECELADVPRNAWPVLTVDPAWKGTENHGEGDAASGQLWFMARAGGLILRYLADGFHSRSMSSNDGEQEIFRLLNKWGARAVAPEEHGGQTFRQSLRNAAIGMGMPLTVIDLKLKTTNKGQRMVSFLKEADAGRVFFIKDTVPPEVLTPLRDQMDNYHPDMDDDDALDCAGYSLDPNISKNWAPAWNSGQGRPFQQSQQSQEAPRTRHCGL